MFHLLLALHAQYFVKLANDLVSKYHQKIEEESKIYVKNGYFESALTIGTESTRTFCQNFSSPENNKKILDYASSKNTDKEGHSTGSSTCEFIVTTSGKYECKHHQTKCFITPINIFNSFVLKCSLLLTQSESCIDHSNMEANNAEREIVDSTNSETPTTKINFIDAEEAFKSYQRVFNIELEIITVTVEDCSISIERNANLASVLMFLINNEQVFSAQGLTLERRYSKLDDLHIDLFFLAYKTKPSFTFIFEKKCEEENKNLDLETFDKTANCDQKNTEKDDKNTNQNTNSENTEKIQEDRVNGPDKDSQNRAKHFVDKKIQSYFIIRNIVHSIRRKNSNHNFYFYSHYSKKIDLLELQPIKDEMKKIVPFGYELSEEHFSFGSELFYRGVVNTRKKVIESFFVEKVMQDTSVPSLQSSEDSNDTKAAKNNGMDLCFLPERKDLVLGMIWYGSTEQNVFCTGPGKLFNKSYPCIRELRDFLTKEEVKFLSSTSSKNEPSTSKKVDTKRNSEKSCNQSTSILKGLADKKCQIKESSDKVKSLQSAPDEKNETSMVTKQINDNTSFSEVSSHHPEPDDKNINQIENDDTTTTKKLNEATENITSELKSYYDSNSNIYINNEKVKDKGYSTLDGKEVQAYNDNINNKTIRACFFYNSFCVGDGMISLVDKRFVYPSRKKVDIEAVLTLTIPVINDNTAASTEGIHQAVYFAIKIPKPKSSNKKEESFKVKRLNLANHSSKNISFDVTKMLNEGSECNVTEILDVLITSTYKLQCSNKNTKQHGIDEFAAARIKTSNPLEISEVIKELYPKYRFSTAYSVGESLITNDDKTRDATSAVFEGTDTKESIAGENSLDQKIVVTREKNKAQKLNPNMIKIPHAQCYKNFIGLEDKNEKVLAKKDKTEDNLKQLITKNHLTIDFYDNNVCAISLYVEEVRPSRTTVESRFFRKMIRGASVIEKTSQYRISKSLPQTNASKPDDQDLTSINCEKFLESDKEFRVTFFHQARKILKNLYVPGSCFCGLKKNVSKTPDGCFCDTAAFHYIATHELINLDYMSGIDEKQKFFKLIFFARLKNKEHERIDKNEELENIYTINLLFRWSQENRQNFANLVSRLDNRRQPTTIELIEKSLENLAKARLEKELLKKTKSKSKKTKKTVSKESDLAQNGDSVQS